MKSEITTAEPNDFVPCLTVVLTKRIEPHTGALLWEAQLPFMTHSTFGPTVEEALTRLNEFIEFGYKAPVLHTNN